MSACEIADDEGAVGSCGCCADDGAHDHDAATCQHVCCPDWDDEA